MTQKILDKIDHHAFVFIGNKSLGDIIVRDLEEVHSIPKEGNPDFSVRSYASFSIDDARVLKEEHGTRPVHESGKKIFILSVDSFTSEASNALLKLLEEPAPYAHFFFIIPGLHILLPTVRSRVKIIEISGDEHTSNNEEATEWAINFLSLNSGKRMDAMKKLVDEIGKETKSKQEVISYIDALEAAIIDKKGIKEGKKALETISFVRIYMNDRSPSMKMLFDLIALNV